MHKSSLIALAISILTAVLSVSTAAQQKSLDSSRTDLAIEIGDGRYGRAQVSSSEGSYRQISLPPKRAESKA